MKTSRQFMNFHEFSLLSPYKGTIIDYVYAYFLPKRMSKRHYYRIDMRKQIKTNEFNKVVEMNSFNTTWDTLLQFGLMPT